MIAVSVHSRFNLNWIIKDDEELERKVRKILEFKLEKTADLDVWVNGETEDDPLDIPSRASSVMNELELYLLDQEKTLQ